MKECKKCLLPENYPGVTINEDNYCNFCSGYEKKSVVEKRQTYREDLEKTLTTIKGEGEFDVVIGLSGGKDSIYLLHKLVNEYKLRVLAITLTDSLTDLARQNIEYLLEKINISHIYYTPPKNLLKELFAHVLQNQNPKGANYSICYICGPVKALFLLNFAIKENIPLVALGYSPAQPEADEWEYELSEEKIRKTFIMPNDRYEAIINSGILEKNETLKYLLSPGKYDSIRLPRMLAPLHAWDYSEEDIMDSLVEFDLVRNKKKAHKSLTNCDLNWLLMYSDLKNLGYVGYLDEFSQLIRGGMAEKGNWKSQFKLLNLFINSPFLFGKTVRKQLEYYGLKKEDLQIEKGE